MRRWVLLLALSAAACSKPNPAATCADGVCSDPAFPFCDTDGAFGGPPNTCVAITCAPGSVGGCRGSAALVCNAAGDSYDAQACETGCMAPAGCTTPPPAACTANAITCTTDGSLQTCDVNGMVASTEPCELGCSDTGGSHCKQVIPSNDLQTFYDQTPNPSDLTLAGGRHARSRHRQVHADERHRDDQSRRSRSSRRAGARRSPCSSARASRSAISHSIRRETDPTGHRVVWDLPPSFSRPVTSRCKVACWSHPVQLI